MRRHYFYWTYLVLAIILTMYGGYIVIYDLVKKIEVSLLSIIFLVVGLTMLVIFSILLLISYFQRKKEPEVNQIDETKPEELEPEQQVEPEEKEEIKTEPLGKPSSKPVENNSGNTTHKRSGTTSGFRGGSAYIRKVGYGPVLRVENDIILDMRSNEYYRIEGNMVNKSGSGPVFEISGNRIRSAFGGYLYEISGGSVNKTYGGFYASIDDSSIQVHDLSERYEISDSLNLPQKLAVVALLFERH